MEIRNHGFIADVIEPDNYILGGATSMPKGEPLVPSGQWDTFLPEYEPQERNGLETSNCTAYGTLNCLEALYNRVFGAEKNWSERFLGIIAGTRPPGNSPHRVCEAIRKNGVVDEHFLPFSKDIKAVEEYYSPDPVPENLLDLAQNWLERYDFRHEWVFLPQNPFADKKEAILEALGHSPVGVSVFAWQWKEKNGEKVYTKPEGLGDNHWGTLYGYKKGEYWKFFDHYDESHKKLDWNYDFGYAKAFSIRKRERKPNFWERILNYFD